MLLINFIGLFAFNSVGRNKEVKVSNITDCDYLDDKENDQAKKSPEKSFVREAINIWPVSNLEYVNNYKDLGEGVVNPITFSFTLILDTVSMDSIRINNIEESNVFRPIFYKPDYLIFYLVVQKKYDNYYMVNVAENQVGFVRRSEFVFFTWEDLFLKKINCLIIRTGYLDRGKKTLPVEFNDEDYFKCIEIDNDWLYVEKENSPQNKYWIKWKIDEGLNVEPVFFN